MTVTEAMEEQAIRGQEGAPAEAGTAFDAAVSEFLAYPPSREASADKSAGLPPLLLLCVVAWLLRYEARVAVDGQSIWD